MFRELLLLNLLAQNQTVHLELQGEKIFLNLNVPLSGYFRVFIYSNNIYDALHYLKAGETGMSDKKIPIKEFKNFALLSSISPTKLDREQLEKRLRFASKCIELQIQKLDQLNDRFIQKERLIFTKIVDAYNNHEFPCGCELADARRMCRFLISVQIVLDRTLLRLQTISNFDNAVTILGTCIRVIRHVSLVMPHFILVIPIHLPEIGDELSIVGDLLSGLMLEICFNIKRINLDFDAFCQEASKILAEATSATTRKEKEIFQLLPGEN